MGRFVITGGNSGIGLEIARGLVSKGHDVVLLGRSKEKCDRAAASLGARATGLPCELSTHAGVRAAAEALGEQPLDGLIHCAGVLTVKDVRTADGLHPVFAVNYLSRFHLTELCRPRLRAAPSPAVIFIVAGVPESTRIDFSKWPRYQPFPGFKALPQIQLSNHHYAQALAKAEPRFKVALCNVGIAKTEIMRELPLPVRVGFALVAPVLGVSVHTAAANPVRLATSEGWASGTYFPKPGTTEVSKPVKLDDISVQKVMEGSRELTGSMG